MIDSSLSHTNTTSTHRHSHTTYDVLKGCKSLQMTGQYGMGGCVRKCQKFECVPLAQSSFPIATHTHTHIPK